MIRKKNIKRIVSFVFVILLSFNSFAAVVSDNDGSAFITKAEFDSLKNNFQSQIDSYNSSIDNKIDDAIASYLAGVKVEKESTLNLSLPNEVYCMLYKSNSETKDLQYVYARPEITGEGIEWHANTGGTYAYHYSFNGRAGEGTGERNMIDDLYLSSLWRKSSARWLGHWKNVKEKYVINLAYGKVGGSYGKHNNGGQFECVINPVYTNLENKILPLSGNITDMLSWNISYGLSSGNPNGSNGYAFFKDYPFSNIKFSKYELEKQSNFEETMQDLIIFYPEDYYGFTYNNENENFIGFDRYKVTSDSSSTVAPTLHSEYPIIGRFNGGTYSDGPTVEAYNNNREKWFSTIFNTASSVTTYRGYFQTNFGVNNATTGNLTFHNKFWIEPYLADYDNVHGAQGANNYLWQTKRYPWPIVTFPWSYIENWCQLWQSQTDWAIPLISNYDENSWLIRWFEDEPHLSLCAGYPVFEVKKGRKYKFELKFKEGNDHLVFLHYGPFYTSYPETESDKAITKFEQTSDAKVDTRYTNAIIVEGGKTVKVIFEAAEDNVLFLKWCDNPSPTNYINGGGTMIMPKTVTITEPTK